MDVIQKYIPDIKSFADKHEACDRVISEFMQNYDQIVAESDTLFICKYFMSSILGLCADIDYQNHILLEQFIRFFVDKQSGIWDIWSVFNFSRKNWISIELCLGVKLNALRRDPGLGLRYIVVMAHKLDIEFTDPMDSSSTIRFIDYPRFDAIQSQSDLWRNIHRPTYDCTLLPEKPHLLRLFLQFGGSLPITDYQTQHLIHRIEHFDSEDSKLREKKLLWIKLFISDTSHRTQLYRGLERFGNQLIANLRNTREESQNSPVLKSIERVPSLQQLARYRIRSCLRTRNLLPEGIERLTNGQFAEYLNLVRL